MPKSIAMMSTVGTPPSTAPPSSAAPAPAVAPTTGSTGSTAPFRFGVYPGGGTGETPNYVKPSDAAVVAKARELAAGKRLTMHLYTAWSWHDDTWLDQQFKLYGDAGFDIALTVKYSPPAGHDGDLAGFEAFVRRITNRYGKKPGILSFCIGNEANHNGDPNASDGPFRDAPAAVARGVVAARQQLDAVGSTADVGFNFAFHGASDDTAFMNQLARLGGEPFTSAVELVGLQVYPGIWYPGGPPYTDMLASLESARASVDAVPGLRGKALEVLETGAPLLDEADEAVRLDALVRAVLDSRQALNVVHVNWFDLWDADSRSTNQFAHYGLLRSDLSEKPAFGAYKRFIAAA